jgi:hypothetical protein
MGAIGCMLTPIVMVAAVFVAVMVALASSAK